MAKIRLCPKCKKPKLRPLMNVRGLFGLAADMFECDECHYRGRFHIVVDTEDYKLDDDSEVENLKES